VADSALIYLAPGAFQDALADARVLFQESRADSPRQGSLGEALEGEMAGKSLTQIVNGNHFWFAWGASNPDTLIYRRTS
jgi:general secretion pathway protein L